MILGAYAIIAIVVAVLMYYEDVGDLYLYDDSHWLVRMGVHVLYAIFAAAVGVMWPLFAVFGVGAGAISGIAWLINRYVREGAREREIIRDLVDDEDAGLVAQQDPSNALDYGPPVTVGRVVHYATPEGPLAAIVSRVRDANLVDLHVLAIYEHRPVLFLRAKSFDGSEEPAAGTWHWPPRA